MSNKSINIYRITHIDNIPHILKYGITHRNSKNANPHYKAIGDVGLIQKRDGTIVRVTNGTRVVIEKIRLGEYIPFYFGIRMPMLYVIQKGGNGVEQPTPPEDIVYVVCSTTRIYELGLTFYFSDGHARDAFTIFYNQSRFKDLHKIIDYNAIKSLFWGGHENLDKKRRKQAEFLVKNDIPPECIIGFVCYNEEAKKKLINFGIEETKIKVIPNAYF